MARIVILTSHLSGSGHLTRSLRLAEAAVAREHEAYVINGGRALTHLPRGEIETIQLPPLLVQDLDFGTLRDAEGRPASASYLKQRQDRLVTELAQLAPDLLITELYPFGRRMLSQEFEAAIEAARPARIVCSIRDIPEPKPKRFAETDAKLAQAYDAILVHGDQNVASLDETWPLTRRSADMAFHTGYLAPAPIPTRTRGHKVVVAVGGGTLGRAVLKLATEAAEQSNRPWHLLTAGPDAVETAQALQGRADNLMAEPAHAGYPSLLAKAGCSVSLCGYNTAVELAQSDVPALFIPSEEGGEQEQLIRARSFQRAFGIPYKRAANLTGTLLSETVEALIAKGPRQPTCFEDGASNAIAALERILIVERT